MPTEEFFKKYLNCVAGFVGKRSNAVILDAGGGRVCELARQAAGKTSCTLIALDSSIDEMKANADVHLRIAADANATLPFADSSVDFVVSSRFMEHLRDPRRFVKESFRILHPGGMSIHYLPCAFAPFALIKRVLPHSLIRRLLTRLYPDDQQSFCWAKLYYRKCTPRALQTAFRRSGFEIRHVEYSYDQALWFRAIPSLYYLNRIYDSLARRLDFSALAAYMIIVAQKPSRDEF